MLNVIKRLYKEEEGQGMVEYGIILAGVAVIVILAVFALGGKINTLFKDITEQLGDGIEEPTP